MAELRAEHLQKDHVILLHGVWVAIEKTPTMGRQFVIITTQFGETGLKFGALLQVQDAQQAAGDLMPAEYIEFVSLAARLASDAPAIEAEAYPDSEPYDERD